MTKSVNRIQELREARSWHRTVIGAAFNVGERTVRRWESGEIAVPSDLIPGLADLFGVTPEYLMGWDRQPIETASVGKGSGS